WLAGSSASPWASPATWCSPRHRNGPFAFRARRGKVSCMRLTILGCAGSVPGPGTNASGYLLEADDFTLALDLGNGTVSALQQLQDPFDLDALLLSHLHPDHCADFAALTVIRRYHPERPGADRRLPVYGPAGTEQRLVNLYAPNERERAETDLTDSYSFAPLPSEPTMIGPFEVRSEERRVGKEGRSRWSGEYEQKDVRRMR